MAAQLLSSLPAAGVDVDAYIAGTDGDLGPLSGIDGLRLIREPLGWEWNRWYSRNRLSAVISGQAARLEAQRRLIRRLLDSGISYDVIYQFSQFESPWSRATARRLPPIVVHPEVHAAGELRWHRRENRLSRTCEPLPTRVAVRGMLVARTLIQRHGAAFVDAYVAPSTVFACDIARDYRIDTRRVHVVPNPIDLGRFSRVEQSPDPPATLDLAYVSRIAVRKGVELIVALSHRLDDLAGLVRIRIVGDKAMFSNYRPLLDDLNPAVAIYEGTRSALQLADLYHTSAALLQPSHYEPFAFTVGEALASGLPVVASSQVGAAEGVDRQACRVFPAGDLDAFEAAVRQLVDDLRAGRRPALGAIARSEAERRFASDVVARQLVDVFTEVGSSR